MTLTAIAHRLLDHPIAFELQQRVFNNYDAVEAEFADILRGSPMRIIDIGCSTATCASNIVDMSRHDYLGVDIDAGYVAIAQKRAPKGKFLAADARRLAFPDGSFDLAMFVGVMHHMDDAMIRDCLAEVRRILKPEGRVIVAEPVFTPSRWLSTMLLRRDRGRFIREEASYRALLGGFEIERQRFFDFSMHRFCAYVLRPMRR